MPDIFSYVFSNSLIPLILYNFGLNIDLNRYLKTQNLSLIVLLFLVKFWEFLMHNLTYNIILWIPVLMLMFQHQDECFKDDHFMRIFVNNQRMLYFSYK